MVWVQLGLPTDSSWDQALARPCWSQVFERFLEQLCFTNRLCLPQLAGTGVDSRPSEFPWQGNPPVRGPSGQGCGRHPCCAIGRRMSVRWTLAQLSMLSTQPKKPKSHLGHSRKWSWCVDSALGLCALTFFPSKHNYFNIDPKQSLLKRQSMIALVSAASFGGVFLQLPGKVMDKKQKVWRRRGLRTNTARPADLPLRFC